MFRSEDEEYLVRKLGRNEVVLFVGSGFSTDAKNRLGEPIPTGPGLAEQIWRFVGLEGNYDGTQLSEMYEVLLARGIPHATIRQFLEEHLLCSQVPEFYDAVVWPFWHRLYTTNIDNVLDWVYTRARPHFLKISTFPSDEAPERDQFLNSVQAFYLNGRLPCQPTEVTFSVRQYARAAVRRQPLYEQFVRDYATHCTVFIGTQLDEPVFWQCVAARQERAPEASEQRPKSFLISARISPPKKAQLSQFNIVPVETSCEDFLTWLGEKAQTLPERIEVLRRLEPTLIELIESRGASERDLPEIREFSAAFHRVPIERSVPDRTRSLYLLGASPMWEDLLADLDAPRPVTDTLLGAIDAGARGSEAVQMYALLGSAGCGKSTILRRLGIRLVQAGRTVYLTNSECLPRGTAIAKALNAMKERVVLLFDNAEVALMRMPEIVTSASTLEHPPQVVLASRTNDFDRLSGRFPESLLFAEFPVPNLCRQEIDALLAILERHHLLGRLQGLTPAGRVQEFEARARRQILVAMREATLGRGFDQIIEDEFSRLVPEEAKLLYLCVALASEAGYRVTKEEFVACARVSPSEALHILMRNLRDIVLASGSREDLLLLRHRLIAEYMVGRAAPRAALRQAYERILGALAPLVVGKSWRHRNFCLFRDLINHKSIYERFQEDIEEARRIYESVADVLQAQSEFWLQFGNLELEGRGGDLGRAENYIAQAESLAPGDAYVANSKGHLLLRKAVEASTLAAAVGLLEEGSAILEIRLEETGLSDAYAVHIFCTQRLRWARVWYQSEKDKQLAELERLRKILSSACRIHFRHRRLATLRDDVEREYLGLAVSVGGLPTGPFS